MHYTKKERCLFGYWNGEKNLKADPMAVQRRLLQANPGLTHDIKKMQLAAAVAPKIDQGEEVSELDNKVLVSSLEAADRLINATRHAFKVVPLSDDGEQGLTDSEVLELLLCFNEYMTEVKKNTSEQPI